MFTYIYNNRIGQHADISNISYDVLMPFYVTFCFVILHGIISIIIS